jgi:hypothetical protein
MLGLGDYGKDFQLREEKYLVRFQGGDKRPPISVLITVQQ